MTTEFEQRVLEGLKIIQDKQNLTSGQIKDIVKDEITAHEKACRKGDVLDTIEKWFVLAQNNPVMAVLFLVVLGIAAYFGLK